MKERNTFLICLHQLQYNSPENSIKSIREIQASLHKQDNKQDCPSLFKKPYLRFMLIGIAVGIFSGVLASLGSILAMAVLFGFTHQEYVSFLPKSITTAIGMGVSEELGGYVSITVAIIVLTGVLGNMCAESVCKLFKIEEPIAKGIAIGTASHAIGTSKAMELGDIEGAMSSLSIVVSGLITVIGASVFAQFM